MLLLPLVVAASISLQAEPFLTDVGRAYVEGARAPEVEVSSPRPLTGAALALNRFRAGTDPAGGRAQLIIGDAPAETLTIRGVWIQEGDILVINDGVLLVSEAELTIHGDLLVIDQGTFLAECSTIVLAQEYLYQRKFLATDSATFEIRDCTVSASGYPYNFAIAGNADVLIDTVHYEDFTTCLLSGGPRLEERHVNLAGEFVVMDSSAATFVDVDTLLLWCSMMESSVIDFAFPSETPVYDWRFDSSVPGVDGVDYSVYCDSVRTPWWGMLSGSGSDVTIRDSEIRTCGIFFEGSSADTLSGFVNGMTYPDHTFPFSDRTLRFVGTSVQTISLYPWDSAQLSFSSSIVGEVLSMADAFVLGMNYYLDGTGGHIEANGTSVNLAGLAMITADALAREDGILILAACSQLWGQNWADGSSRLFLVQTQTNSLPLAFDAATAGYQFVSGPASAEVGEIVPITGSVWVDAGPLGTADLLGYRVFYERTGQQERHPIGPQQTVEVREGTLIAWDTEGLAAGQYALIVEFYDTLGDTLAGFSPIRLDPQPPSSVEEGPTAAGFEAYRSGDALRFLVSPIEPGPIRLLLYDVAGRRIASPLLDRTVSGPVSVDYRPRRSGIYFARLETPGGSVVKKLLFAK